MSLITWLSLGWFLPAVLSLLVLGGLLYLVYLALHILGLTAERWVEIWYTARTYIENLADRQQDRALEQDKAEMALDRARFPTDANRHNLSLAARNEEPFVIGNLEKE